jgi:hypothetical protein
MYFNLNARPGEHGGEGLTILAFQPEQMLSVTWNAPPELAGVRGQRTHVSVRLSALTECRTRVTLRHDGWGEGIEWDRAFAYFERAWGKIVLPRLTHRFLNGPIDWEHPPETRGL